MSPKTTLFAFVVTAAALACADSGPPQASTTVASQPLIIDHYTLLSLQELRAPNPAEVAQQISCEVDRINGAVGATEGAIRMRTADDTIYTTPALRARHEQLNKASASQMYLSGGHVCDSLNAIANTTWPIAPVAAKRP